MKRKASRLEPSDDLRLRAERAIPKRTGSHEEISADEAKRLIHELDVHQAELEMQNEELRRTQIELSESRGEYLDLYDFAPVGYFSLDKGGKITRANITGADMLGVPRSRLINTSFTHFVAQEDRQIFLSFLRKLFESGPNTCGVKIHRKDGSPLYVSVKGAALNSKGSGMASRIVLTDISELKRTEQQLSRVNRDLEDRIRESTAQGERLKLEVAERTQTEKTLISEYNFRKAIEEAMIGGLAVSDASGRMIYVNDAFCKMVGWTEHELVGIEPPFPYWPPELEDEMAKRYADGMKGEGSSQYEMILRRRGEERFDVLASVSALLDHKGERIGFVRLFLDITDRKAAERQIRRLSSELISAQEKERKRVSHEIHDTFGAALSAIKFKVEEAIIQTEKGGFGAVGRSLRTITPVIQEAIDEGRRIQMDLHPSILDDLGIISTLSWFFRRFQEIYRAIAVEQKIDIEEKDVPGPLKPVVYRVTQEALNNIAKHSGADSVTLSLKRNNGAIDLLIQDNGKGFDLNAVMNAKASMNGLGLSSMRERVQYSGGSFCIDSVLEKGTIIGASWPLRDGLQPH
jgi:PAS domain S-box-containing protein